MLSSTGKRETRRGELQAELDSRKSQRDRNKLGQFATPLPLAREVVSYGLKLLPKSMPVRFLDPAIGTGAFYSALQSTGHAVKSAAGFEVDPHYGRPAQTLWKGSRLKIKLSDFTRQAPPKNEEERATLLICNPPYVRHHHLEGEEKVRLQWAAFGAAGIKLSGLSGLYCYFMALAHRWMSRGAIAGWLIPSEFMDVNYGRALRAYLLREVTLIGIHRFDPTEVQFSDALVSSAVVWFKNETPVNNSGIRFSYGGTIEQPAISRVVSVSQLERANKWTQFPRNSVVEDHKGIRLGDLFTVKRGLATGDNSFFIVDEDRTRALNLPRKFLRPVLPSSRHIKADEVLSDADGVPLLDKRLFLIDCDLSEKDLEENEPALWTYLQSGGERVASRYLCRTRRYWYAQEKRPPAPIVCTYLGRSDHDGRPFRFILNHSQATATNVYLMLYPQPHVARHLARHPEDLRRIWKALNEIRRESLLGNGRVYGGGLHKLEPKELANVPADELAPFAGLVRGAPEQLVLGHTAETCA